jgi:hypothetical protein
MAAHPLAGDQDKPGVPIVPREDRDFYSDTVRFKPLPRLCISSPTPRSVAHPPKLNKSNANTSSFFFFIFDSKVERRFVFS